MKKIIISCVLAISLICGLSSCEDFLNEQNPNAIPAKSYFSSESDVDKAVLGIYQALRSNNCLGESSLLFTEERSDNMGRDDNGSNAGEPFQFTNFSLATTNTFLKSHWNALYEGVDRANFVLSNIDKVPFADEKQREIYRSEALFCRALLYFHLVCKWGDVPMVTEFLTDYQQILAKTARVKRDLVYQQIVADLTKALNSEIPNIQAAAGKGRTCRAAINGLLGQTYLTMGALLEADKVENFVKAKQYLMAAYQMRTFGNLSEIPYADVFDVAKKHSNKEILFQIVYLQGDLTYSSAVARNNQSVGETINSKYVSTGKGTSVKVDLVDQYEAGDIRKDFTVRYANNSKAKDWFITKFRDASEAAGTNGRGGNDWILMRFADIMLLLAEAHMYLGQDAQAIALLDEVRSRAGLPSYAISMTDATYSSKYPTLKLAILHERRSELACEGQRLYDLLRAFSAKEFKEYFQSKDASKFGITDVRNCGEKDILYPIPFDEYKLDPEKMYQNAGY